MILTDPASTFAGGRGSQYYPRAGSSRCLSELLKMEEEEQPTLPPRQQLVQALHFLMHNHIAQGVVAAIILIIFLFWLMKYVSTGKLRALEASAKNGDMAAAALLGECYQYGEEGAPTNYKKAERWYRAAAAAGNAAGQNGLGSLYFNGDGVDQNNADAFRYYELSAKQGNPMGQANLALMHYRGKGTEQNTQKAYFWALLAKTNKDSVDIQKRTESFNKFFHEVYTACPAPMREAPEKRAKDWVPEKKTSGST